MTITPQIRPLTELHRRENDGVEVALLWSRDDGRAYVAVTDTGTGESFTIEIAPSAALDAFHHPYAYAAARGLEFRSGRREAVYA